MAQFLHYDFEKLNIKKDVYSPAGHNEIESDQTVIRKGQALLLSGQVALPIDVKHFPADIEVRKKEKGSNRLEPFVFFGGA